MTLTRILAILLGVFLVMMTIVVLRAETTRFENRIAKLDREQIRLRKALQREAAEMARWNTSDEIRTRLRDLNWNQTLDGSPPIQAELDEQQPDPASDEGD